MGGGPDYALVLPGSASSVDFVLRAFAPIIGSASVRAVSTESGDAEQIVLALATQRRQLPTDARVLVVGVSLGAHAAALWAARAPRESMATAGGIAHLVLALPAWTGPPTAVAAMSGAAADQVAASGLDSHLQRLNAEFGDDWVAREVTLAWQGRPEAQVVHTLRATAASAAPTVEQLAAIRAPTTVVALADDPLHPEAVARTWASTIPNARLAVVGRDEPGADVAALGRAVAAGRGA